MSSRPKVNTAEWDALIDRFLASGFSQSALCEREGISRYVFARHYQRSDKFAGTRRGSKSVKNNGDRVSALRAVKILATVLPDHPGGQSMSIYIAHDIRIQCSAGVGIEVIMRWAREAQL